jgi:hypothetical protein
MIGKNRAAPGGILERDRDDRFADRRAPPRETPASRPTIERQNDRALTGAQASGQAGGPANGMASGQGVARTVLGTLVLGVFVVVALASGAAWVLPTASWIDRFTPKTEITGTITAARIETPPRGFARRWRVERERLVVKVAPYSFGFAFRCDDKEHCRELLARVKRGNIARVTVDKAAFEELKPSNRTVDRNSRDPGRVGQQIVAADVDQRRVAMYRLVANGAVVIAGE